MPAPGDNLSHRHLLESICPAWCVLNPMSSGAEPGELVCPQPHEQWSLVSWCRAALPGFFPQTAAKALYIVK